MNDINEEIERCIKTGVFESDWNEFKIFLKVKLREINNDEELLAPIFRDLDRIEKVPFTVQRICEMIKYPNSHYKNTKKFLFSFHKLVNLDY
jgi:hypothetical protein